MRYVVSQYDEGPVVREPAVEFTTLREARAEVRRRRGHLLRRVTTLAGERYGGGERHVEAYYDDAHQSSGLWITTREEARP